MMRVEEGRRISDKRTRDDPNTITSYTTGRNCEREVPILLGRATNKAVFADRHMLAYPLSRSISQLMLVEGFWER